ncbi:MAG: PAS domain S-box protein, partial [Gammaproteobacteria bacterium]|nr:PAS domain S-box protein [Gammaproteobacteria bacterium]
MKFRLPGLTVLLSFAMLAFVSILLVSSMTIDLNNRKEELIKRSTGDIKKQIAKLTRLAERVLIIDPQLLFEDISQEGSDPRVAFSAVILSSGKTLFSTDFSQNNKIFDNTLPYYDKELYDKAISVRTMQLKVEGDSMLAYMSFSEPAEKDEMRGLSKGIVIISYNLKKDKDNLFNIIIKERMLDILLSLVVAVIFIFLIRKYIISPILLLQESARAISKGDYKGTLSLTGPVEIQNLMTSFNDMSNSLQNYINSIKESSQNTETVIENVVDGIITIDMKGIVLSYNRSAETIFGYSREEIIGQNISKLMTDVDFRQHDQYLEKYINSPDVKVIGISREIKGLRKNGEIFPIEIGVSEIERNSQRLFIGIIRDMSEKIKAEKIKREFVSTVSHELRTPLTAMQGAVTLVSSGVLGELSEQASELLISAKRNGDRLLALI